MIKKIVIIIGLLVLIAGFIGGVVYLSNSYLNKKDNKISTAINCEGKEGAIHEVIIQNDTVTPANTNGKLCDTITITNKDDKSRDIAFGQHDHHVAYDGIEVKTIGKDQSFTIFLNKAGQYIFHDHDQDAVKGSFVVLSK